MKQHALRLTDEVFAALETFRARTGFNRNEQIVRMIQSVLDRQSDQPLTVRPTTVVVGQRADGSEVAFTRSYACTICGKAAVAAYYSHQGVGIGDTASLLNDSVVTGETVEVLYACRKHIDAVSNQASEATGLTTNVAPWGNEPWRWT